MPLFIPNPKGSLIPFLTQVKKYLLKETANRKNQTPSDYIVDLHAFAESINPDTISIDAFFQGLSQAEQHNIAGERSYRNHILDGLGKYLTKKNTKGFSVLLIALPLYPDALASIIAAIVYLDSKQQAMILRQTDDAIGWNALMTAIRYAPKMVDSILKTMTRLSLDDQANIYSQVTSRGRNALLLAARHNPQSMTLILAGIAQLNQNDQVAIFNQITYNDCGRLKQNTSDWKKYS